MKIQLPTVGPIVGYTTERQARVFFRGDALADAGQIRRCFGAVRWRRAGTQAWSEPVFNKLSPNFDMTGVFVLSKLAAMTHYEYQAGWFCADAELDQLQGLAALQLEWPDVKLPYAVHMLRTGTAETRAPRAYVFGSCRYLLRLFGGSWFDDRGDKVFRSILAQIHDAKAPRPIDALLMLGDQIYADDLDFLSPDTKVDQFLARYRNVFSQPHLRELMAQVPTYMILDDHEIEDNWPAKATAQDLRVLYPQAIHAYQVYQSSHSPVFKATPDGRIEGTPTRFWYTFADGCADWFVMDTRTERVLSGPEPKIVSAVQMQELGEWLLKSAAATPERVRFIVTSVPVFPDFAANASEARDKWQGFAQQRTELLDFIRTRKIGKVVFVSGDLHCSFAAQLTVKDDPSFQVTAIVSSAFFWPYPQARSSSLQFDSALTTTGPTAYVARRLSSEVHVGDNFARMDVTPEKIEVRFYERKGALLGKPVVLPLIDLTDD